MGQKLVQLFKFAEDKGGMTAKMRVAMKAVIPSNKAEELPDNDDNIKKVKAAIKEILGVDAP